MKSYHSSTSLPTTTKGSAFVEGIPIAAYPSGGILFACNWQNASFTVYGKHVDEFLLVRIKAWGVSSNYILHKNDIKKMQQKMQEHLLLTGQHLPINDIIKHCKRCNQ